MKGAASEVAPYGGAWIETYLIAANRPHVLSLPMGERGLKLASSKGNAGSGAVAPYGGAWIETSPLTAAIIAWIVAPYGGAWIETRWQDLNCLMYRVAPYGGAWIETFLTPRGKWNILSLPMGERGLKPISKKRDRAAGRRSLWGSVD